ncbi:hypothetical protein EBZ39_15680 [bacterium]|nr:hypothetical protein [bacterium]
MLLRHVLLVTMLTACWLTPLHAAAPTGETNAQGILEVLKRIEDQTRDLAKAADVRQLQVKLEVMQRNLNTLAARARRGGKRRLEAKQRLNRMRKAGAKPLAVKRPVVKRPLTKGMQ